jgi:ATP-dependent exoDNAse (exonuclease V) alpha subunit
MIKLNEGQEKAAKDIVAFLKGELDIPFFTLSGGPGTGKTFMLKEAIKRSNISRNLISGATVSHAAKNVLDDSLNASEFNKIDCYTIAKSLGMDIIYRSNGDIDFIPNPKLAVYLRNYKVHIIDEASMIPDDIYNRIMRIVKEEGIKLIIVGDIYQLPPVGQDHDSKFFDRVDATLTEQMRFTGLITTISNIYRKGIEDINSDYVVSPYILNEYTDRKNNWNDVYETGYKFTSDIHTLLDRVAEEIKYSNNDIYYSRILAFKNDVVDILNENIRSRIYGKNHNQFEKGEILISKGGYSFKKSRVIFNGELLVVKDIKEGVGYADIPVFLLEFEKTSSNSDLRIPVVQNNYIALSKYNKVKNNLRSNALKDTTQWNKYYYFINKFAYFDYASAVNTYKAQGQTLRNVYVMEGEIMDVKPLTLKQKFQALYVAMTRATNSLNIYNKNY